MSAQWENGKKGSDHIRILSKLTFFGEGDDVTWGLIVKPPFYNTSILSFHVQEIIAMCQNQSLVTQSSYFFPNVTERQFHIDNRPPIHIMLQTYVSI